MLYAITETAEKLGITAQTLRRWEASGKIKSKKTLGGHRRYDDTDINRILNGGVINQVELFRCWEDVEYFMRNYCKIYNPIDGGYSLIKLLPQQKLLLDAFESNPRNIIKSYRQSTFSTLISCYIAFKLVTCPDYKIIFTTDVLDHSKRILKNVNNILASLPSFFSTNNSFLLKNTSTQLRLFNNSELIIISCNETGLCSVNYDLLIIDHADFIKDFHRFWTSARANSKPNGRVIINSSVNPHHLYTPYDTIISDSQQYKNDFKYIKLDWWKDIRFNKDLLLYKKVNKFSSEVKKDIYNTDGTLNIELCEQLITEGWEPYNTWLEQIIETCGEQMVRSEILCKKN